MQILPNPNGMPVQRGDAEKQDLAGQMQVQKSNTALAEA